MDHLLLPDRLKDLFVWFYSSLDSFFTLMFSPIMDGLGAPEINGVPNPIAPLLQGYYNLALTDVKQFLTTYSLAYVVFSIGIGLIIGINVIKFLLSND